MQQIQEARLSAIDWDCDWVWEWVRDWDWDWDFDWGIWALRLVDATANGL